MLQRSEQQLMEMDDARELFEEAGMLRPKRVPRKPPALEHAKEDIEDLKVEFKEFM